MKVKFSLRVISRCYSWNAFYYSCNKPLTSRLHFSPFFLNPAIIVCAFTPPGFISITADTYLSLINRLQQKEMYRWEKTKKINPKHEIVTWNDTSMYAEKIVFLICSPRNAVHNRQEYAFSQWIEEKANRNRINKVT